jgi:hypothetical protein
MEQLPIQLECFLMTYGFFENDKAPGSHLHAQVKHPKIVSRDPKPTGWTPSFKGEEPPF